MYIYYIYTYILAFFASPNLQSKWSSRNDIDGSPTCILRRSMTAPPTEYDAPMTVPPMRLSMVYAVLYVYV